MTSPEPDAADLRHLAQLASAHRRARRLALALAAVVVIGAGMIIAINGQDLGADLAGDSLYAALVYLTLGVAFPGARRMRLTAAATLLCWLLELTQLTGVLAALATELPAIRYLLGTTFSALDLVGYVAGALTAGWLDRVLSSRLGQHGDEEVRRRAERAQVPGRERGVDPQAAALDIREERLERVPTAGPEAHHDTALGADVGAHAAEHLGLGPVGDERDDVARADHEVEGLLDPDRR